MITLTPIRGGCHVVADTATFDVFPAKPAANTWSLLSHPEEALTDARVISWPGEYDFQGVTLRSIGQEAGKHVSHMTLVQGVRMAFVDAPMVEWTDADVQKLGDIDVFVVAADQPKRVAALVEAIDPRMVVLLPVEGSDIAAVAKACGAASISTVAELKFKHGSLPQDSRQTVVLEA